MECSFKETLNTVIKSIFKLLEPKIQSFKRSVLKAEKFHYPRTNLVLVSFLVDDILRSVFIEINAIF